MSKNCHFLKILGISYQHQDKGVVVARLQESAELSNEGSHQVCDEHCADNEWDHKVES
jgi:hypothetical protein